MVDSWYFYGSVVFEYVESGCVRKDRDSRCGVVGWWELGVCPMRKERRGRSLNLGSCGGLEGSLVVSLGVILWNLL